MSSAIDTLLPDVDQTWRTQAACAGEATRVFFDDGRSVRAAIAVCDRCPVRTECLDFALAWGEAFGIWGGMTAEARERYAKGRPRLMICHHCRNNFTGARRSRLYCSPTCRRAASFYI